MHIPDGYLSPSSCAALYAGSAPFWYVAVKQVRSKLSTQMAPLLALFAAFSFVVMMFNLPLPGGTTGHAVGMGVAAIVIGPWASILAISTALVIQAMLFGDGGITAIGANCFNMAIAGSLAAYAVYRIAAYRAGLHSKRRVLAAGLAGYAGINVAALLAAVEFGIQPLLFHDASGVPLYCPYPLSVSIPAMMLGHLSFAGLAEFIISAGIVRYLQRADSALLHATAPGNMRKLWIGLAVLVILTPLGILAVGSAWGEWSLQELTDPSVRHQIAQASGQRALPDQVPSGLRRFSSFWTAPLAHYAPSLVPSAQLGYLISALAGVGVILLAGAVAHRILLRSRPGLRRRNFVEKTSLALVNAARESIFADELARSAGFLQSFDARVKLAGLGALILATVMVHRLAALAAVFALALGLALLSRIPFRLLAGRVWIAVLGFTGAIALPALFLVPGQIAWRIPVLEWTISDRGLHVAGLLLLRAETAATLAVLLVLTTVWTQLLRGLRFFRVPVLFVLILGMTYRYIFLLLKTAQDMFESRQTRLVGSLEPSTSRRLAAASAGVLLEKTLLLSGEVHAAMLARGFRGDVHILEEPHLGLTHWLPLCGLLAIVGAILWLGR